MNYPQQPYQDQPPQQPYGQPPTQPYGQPYPQQPYPPQYQQMPVPYPQQRMQGRPGPQYVRQQQGHSMIKHVVVACCTCGMSLPITLYYSMSPNHYFHS